MGFEGFHGHSWAVIRGEAKKGRTDMSFKRGSGGGESSARGTAVTTILFCIGSFCAGLLLTNRC